MRLLRPFLISGAALSAFAAATQVKSNRAAAQIAPRASKPSDDPISRLPPPPGFSPGSPKIAPKPAKPTVAATPRATALSTPVPTPVPTPIPVLKPRFIGQKVVRVGLSTAGGAVAVYVPSGATLFDLEQPGLTLSIAPGERFSFAFGPNRASKRGAMTFRGPISISRPGGLSDGWKRVYIAVDGDPARVSTNNESPRFARPYRGDLEVFPQAMAEPFHRKGSLSLVNVVPLEAYLKGVVPWEMDTTAPLEALKAQAICARTETLDFINRGKFTAGKFDICDYDACQGYPGTENEKPSTTQAVEATRGLAIFQNGRPIDAVYSTNSGGITANARDVWKGESPIPYLQSVPDFASNSPLAALWQGGMTEAEWAQFCTRDWPSYASPSGVSASRFEAKNYRWTRFVSLDDANKAFASEGISRVVKLEIGERTASGRIRRIRVSGVDAARLKTMPTPLPAAPTLGGASVVSGADLPLKSVEIEGDGKIRSMFSKRLGSTVALPSSLFVITPVADASGEVSGWNLQGAGWGHGVGMCQRGAQNHAKEGWDARRIVNWYFRGVELKSMS